jgi:hypothetical protein
MAIPKTPNETWSVLLLYDEGRLGYGGMFGCKTREEAEAWLERAFDWKRTWFMLPSACIWQGYMPAGLLRQ